MSSVPKEVLPTYIKLVRDAVSTSRDKERRKKKVAIFYFRQLLFYVLKAWLSQCFLLFHESVEILTFFLMNM